MNRVAIIVAALFVVSSVVAAEFNDKADYDKLNTAHSLGVVDRVLLGKLGNYQGEKTPGNFQQPTSAAN